MRRMGIMQRYNRPNRPVDSLVSLIWLMVGANLAALLMGAKGSAWLTIVLGTIVVWGIYEGTHFLLRRRARHLAARAT